MDNSTLGWLTTHVLDTAQGKPAANMLITLWALESMPSARRLINSVRTNSQGRTDAPLLKGELFKVGRYELVFAVGEYFAGQSLEVSDPPFLDQVPVRFAISDIEAHYHVPLLVSPWSYSVYRGS